jgi:hypothetical protein
MADVNGTTPDRKSRGHSVGPRLGRAAAIAALVLLAAGTVLAASPSTSAPAYPAGGGGAPVRAN